MTIKLSFAPNLILYFKSARSTLKPIENLFETNFKLKSSLLSTCHLKINLQIFSQNLYTPWVMAIYNKHGGYDIFAPAQRICNKLTTYDIYALAWGRC